MRSKCVHEKACKIILTWRGSKPDHWGVSSRVRPLHCTSLGLTSAIATSVSNSTVQFLVVGACVRARPLLYEQMKNIHLTLACLLACFLPPLVVGRLVGDQLINYIKRHRLFSFFPRLRSLRTCGALRASPWWPVFSWAKKKIFLIFNVGLKMISVFQFEKWAQHQK